MTPNSFTFASSSSRFSCSSSNNPAAAPTSYPDSDNAAIASSFFQPIFVSSLTRVSISSGVGFEVSLLAEVCDNTPSLEMEVSAVLVDDACVVGADFASDSDPDIAIVAVVGVVVVASAVVEVDVVGSEVDEGGED